MGVRDQLHAPATLPLGSKLSTHLIGGWVGPTASLNVLENKNIFCPDRIETLDCPAPRPSHYVDNTIAACGHYKNNEVCSVLYLMMG